MVAQGKGVPESRVPQYSWELTEDVGDYVEVRLALIPPYSPFDFRRACVSLHFCSSCSLLI